MLFANYIESIRTVLLFVYDSYMSPIGTIMIWSGLYLYYAKRHFCDRAIISER